MLYSLYSYSVEIALVGLIGLLEPALQRAKYKSGAEPVCLRVIRRNELSRKQTGSQIFEN